MEHLNKQQLKAFRVGLLEILNSSKVTTKDLILYLQCGILASETHPISVTSLSNIAKMPRQSVKNRVDKMVEQGFLGRTKGGGVFVRQDPNGRAATRCEIILKTADQIRAASSTDQSTYSLPLSA